MSEKNNSPKEKSVSTDWLVRGVLTKIGEIADSFTGRSAKPSSSLATSELIERLKKLLDSEAKQVGKGYFVPHHIKLKMQWNKFSTDSDDALKRLQYEIQTAAIDHINDNRYHTFAPLNVEVKTDYFVEGIQLIVGFDKFDEEQREVEMKVTMPSLKVNPKEIPVLNQEEEATEEIVLAEFTIQGKQKQNKLDFSENKRINVGRTKENNLVLEDGSVSKVHASLVLSSENKLMVADTGSTNGTFINGNRLAYGRAFPIVEGDKVSFGNIEVYFRRIPRKTEFVVEEPEIPPTQPGIKIDLTER